MWLLYCCPSCPHQIPSVCIGNQLSSLLLVQLHPGAVGEIYFKIVGVSMQLTVPTCHEARNWDKIKEKSKNTDFCRTGLHFSSFTIFLALCWLYCTSVSVSLELASPGLDSAHRMFLTSAEQRRIISLDLLAKLFLMQHKRLFRLLCCKGTLLVCVQLTVLQGPQDVFLQSCFPSGQPPAYSGAWRCSSPAAGLSISFC